MQFDIFVRWDGFACSGSRHRPANMAPRPRPPSSRPVSPLIRSMAERSVTYRCAGSRSLWLQSMPQEARHTPRSQTRNEIGVAARGPPGRSFWLRLWLWLRLRLRLRLLLPLSFIADPLGEVRQSASLRGRGRGRFSAAKLLTHACGLNAKLTPTARRGLV